jgi:glucose/arabinose dehydrogenase
MVPPGFGIRVWARVPGARFMALAPNGDVLVSNPGQGKVFLLRDLGGDVPQQFDFATGMTLPHDIVFHTIGGTTYLYISESNQVTRSVYQSGDTQSAAREVVVANLPDASSPELQGAYSHALKNIALGPDDKLYVSIGSSCNACGGDTVSEPIRASIYQYNADGSGGRLMAQGVRNAEGLDFLPGTNTLWVTVNGRDQIEYPFHNGFDGDTSDDFGQVIPGYVDNNPPDSFTAIVDGGNYGWPYCNPVPNDSMSNLALIRDVEFNADGSNLDCSTALGPAKGFHAHSAPLGFSFLQNSAVPTAYRSGAAAALHGCWDCTTLKAGYKVTYFPFDGAGNAGAEIDLVTGFIIDPAAHTYWGRPVDVIADSKGNFLISDDFAGAIYQLFPQSQ